MLYNKLIESVFLPLGDWITGGQFMQSLRQVRREVALPADQLQALEAARLKETLVYATTHAPHYRDLNIQADTDPYTWLQRFPILDKPTLRAAGTTMLTVPEAGLIKNGSSGSTGFQSIVYWSKLEQSIFRASQILFWEWGGYKLGDPIVQTGINPNRTREKAIKDWLLNTVYLQAFSHDEADVARVLKQLKSGKYGLMGYASSLYVFAQIAEKYHIDQQRFQYAVTWGDKLFDHYKTAIKKQFGCDVYETYGSAEGFLMASKKDVDYMYWMQPNVYLELVDDQGNPVPDGTLGHVVVTNLHGRAHPMIRYRIGDLAIRLPREAYPEQRSLQLPLLQKVIGRDTDLVRTPGGKHLVVHSFTGIFEHIPEISQFKVIQRTLEGIEIEFIRGAGYTDAVLATTADKLNQLIGESTFSVTFKEVATIAATKSGKPQLVENHLKVVF